MCVDSLPGYSPNIPQFIWPICPNRPIICDIFEKISYHMSIVHDHICSCSHIHFIMSDHKIAMFPTVTEFWKGQFIRLHFSIESAKGTKWVEIFSKEHTYAFGLSSFWIGSKLFKTNQKLKFQSTEKLFFVQSKIIRTRLTYFGHKIIYQF